MCTSVSISSRPSVSLSRSPAVATLILLKVVDRLVGLRVEREDESTGLDLSQHGERAYNE